MLPYWLLFSVTSALALLVRPRETNFTRLGFAVLAGLMLALFIGLRFRVGGDWDAYDIVFLAVTQSPFATGIAVTDPGYSLLNWVVGAFGGEVWHVNLICAALFAYALIRFCSALPLPLVGAVAAIPTLIIVLAMGFTRQATAIACIMLAASTFRGGFSPGWIGWLAVAVTFHRSAIFAVPIFFLASSRHRVLNMGVGVLIGLVLVTTFIFGNLDRLISTYVEGGLESSGAGIRVSICVVIASFYFLFVNRRDLLGPQYLLWRNMGLTALALVPAFFLTSSVVVDRLAFLLLPFQLMVQSYAPVVLSGAEKPRGFLILAVILFNAAILGGWLLLADHSLLWLPYRNVITEPFLY